MQKTKSTANSEKHYWQQQTWVLNWILKENTLNFDSTLGTFITSKKYWNITNVYNNMITHTHSWINKDQKNLFIIQVSTVVIGKSKTNFFFHMPTGNQSIIVSLHELWNGICFLFSWFWFTLCMANWIGIRLLIHSRSQRIGTIG